MSRELTWASNHTELAASTPAAVGSGAGTVIHRLNVTTATTAAIIIYDGISSGGAVLFKSPAVAAVGSQYVLEQRVKVGCWVDPGDGTCSVSWD